MIDTGVRYVIVRKSDGSISWDDMLHPTEKAAIASLCGPRQDYGNDHYDPRPNWRDVYEIRRVLPAKATR